MFINFTNHPSALWSAEQKAAAQVYGKVIDLAFPAIDPATNEAVLDSLATVYADHILHLDPDAVLCQGECTFVYRVVQRLEAAGIPTLAACSRRKRQEISICPPPWYNEAAPQGDESADLLKVFQ